MPPKDIFAADRVVSQIPGDGTDNNVASAIANLPNGGSIFVKAGTYPINLSLRTGPGQNIKIRGSGPATIFNLGAHPISLFDMMGGGFFLESMHARGTGAIGQTLLHGFAGPDGSGAQALMRDVTSEQIETILAPVHADATSFFCENCTHILPSQASSFYFNDPISAAASIDLVNVQARDNIGLFGGIVGAGQRNTIYGGDFTVRSGLSLEGDQSKIHGVLFEGDITHPIQAQIVGNFVDCTLGQGVQWHSNTTTPEVQFLGCRFHGFDNVNPPILLGPNVVNAKICNCDFFEPPDTVVAAIEIHGNHCLIVSNYQCKVVEVAPADFNMYDAIIGFGGSVIVGPNSLVGTVIP
jgi:hypothetical protein